MGKQLADKDMTLCHMAEPMLSSSLPNQYFLCCFFQDLFIGNNVIFFKHSFILVDTDEYAIRYMEAHPVQFPQSNIKMILPKLAELTSSAKEEFKRFLDENGEHASFDDIR